MKFISEKPITTDEICRGIRQDSREAVVDLARRCFLLPGNRVVSAGRFQRQYQLKEVLTLGDYNVQSRVGSSGAGSRWKRSESRLSGLRPNSAGNPAAGLHDKWLRRHGSVCGLKGELTVGPMERALIPTGVAIALPPGFEAQIRPAVVLASKRRD